MNQQLIPNLSKPISKALKSLKYLWKKKMMMNVWIIIPPTKRWMDDEPAEYINQIFNVTEIHNLDKGSRNETPRTIKNKTGASDRQLSRILGIGRGVLEKIN